MVEGQEICFSKKSLEKHNEELKQRYIAVGMELVKNHSIPSPKTIEMLTTMEQQFADLKELLNEKFKTNDECHRALIEQTTKTNGSVRKLQLWRAGLASAISVVIFFVTLFSWMLKSSIEKINYISSLRPVTVDQVSDLIDENNKKQFSSYNK